MRPGRSASTATTDVFLAYASKDGAAARALAAALEEQGVRVATSAEVAPGHDPAAAITAAQRSARCTVVCLSAASSRSPHLARAVTSSLELNHDHPAEHAVIPVYLDDTDHGSGPLASLDRFIGIHTATASRSGKFAMPADVAAEIVHVLRERRIAETYRAAARRVNRDDLHDAVAGRPNILSEGLPYVIRASQWRYLDRARRERRHVPVPAHQIEALEVAATATVLDALVTDERVRRLADALAALPPKQALILYLRSEGSSWEEIALLVSEPADTVRMRYHRALPRLRKELMRRGISRLSG